MTCKLRGRAYWVAWCSLLTCLFSSRRTLLGANGQTNRTIDDSNGDPFTGAMPDYEPVGLWAAGQGCPGCLAQPDKSKVYQGTWHDTTHHGNDTVPKTVSFNFTGTALYVYCIIDNQPGYTTLTALNFTLDGDNAGWYVHYPNSAEGSFVYSVPVYSNNSIPNGNHNFVMTAGGQVDSLVLFDFASYTYEALTVQPNASSAAPGSTTSSSGSTASPTSPSRGGSNNLAAIAGGAAGGVAFLAFVAGVFIFLWRRKKRSHDTNSSNVTMAASTHYPHQPSSANLPPSSFVTQPTYRNGAWTYPSSMSLTSPEAPRSALTRTTETSYFPQTPPSRSTTRATMREAHIKEQLRGYERTVAALRQREGSIYTSSTRTRSTRSAAAHEENRRLREEISAMQREMERLRREHIDLLSEIDSAPPPEYNESLRYDREHGLR